MMNENELINEEVTTEPIDSEGSDIQPLSDPETTTDKTRFPDWKLKIETSGKTKNIVFNNRNYMKNVKTVRQFKKGV